MLLKAELFFQTTRLNRNSPDEITRQQQNWHATSKAQPYMTLSHKVCVAGSYMQVLFIDDIVRI